MSLREHGIIHLKVDNTPEPELSPEAAEWQRQWIRQLRKSARRLEAEELAATEASAHSPIDLGGDAVEQPLGVTDP